MSVFDLKKGECGRVISLNVDGAAGERLKALGVAVGRDIEILAYSFFKGSVLLKAGYAKVALRRAVAERIEVTKIA